MWHDEFEGFVRQHLAALGRHAFLLTGDREDAADLVQEALVRLARAWPRVERTGHPLAYARTILVRLHISGVRRALRWRAASPLLYAGDRVADATETADERIGLAAALARLTPAQRAVIVLTYFDDADDETIARAIRRRPGAVRALRHRALAALRATLWAVPTMDR